MSTNPYEESLLDLAKKNSSTIIKVLAGLALILIIFFTVKWYTSPKDSANAQVDGKTMVRSYNYSQGKKDANIKVIEYSDYECHVCQSYVPTMKEFVKAYDSKVQIVYKHLPVIGINSRSAAEAAQAAGEQGKFVEYNDAVFEKIIAKAVLNSDTLTQIAKDKGLDIVKWNQRRNSKEIKDQVAQDIKDLQDAKLPPSSRDQSTKGGQSTPGFIIIKGDEIVDWWAGTYSLEEFKGKVDKFL